MGWPDSLKYSEPLLDLAKLFSLSFLTEKDDRVGESSKKLEGRPNSAELKCVLRSIIVRHRFLTRVHGHSRGPWSKVLYPFEPLLQVFRGLLWWFRGQWTLFWLLGVHGAKKVKNHWSEGSFFMPVCLLAYTCIFFFHFLNTETLYLSWAGCGLTFLPVEGSIRFQGELKKVVRQTKNAPTSCHFRFVHKWRHSLRSRGQELSTTL